MKRIALTAMALAAGAAPVMADGYIGMKDEYLPPARAYNCTVKVIGAGEFITHKVDAAGTIIDALGNNSLGIGAGFGCDISNGKFVLGAFTDYVWNKASVNISTGGVSMLSTPFGNEWSVGARAGVLTNPSTLLYGLVAYTGAQTTNDSMMGVPFSLSGPKGVTIGGGIETSLGQHIVMSLEYRHTAFDTSTATLLPMTFDTIENSVRVGLGYRF